MSDASFPYKPRLIAIDMVGARPLYSGAVRAALVDALLSIPDLAPEQMSLDESREVPLDRQALSKDWAPSQSTQFLRRTRGQPYELRLALSKSPRLIMEFPAEKTPARSLPLVFRVGDLLAEVFQPDMGWVHIVAEHPAPPLDAEAVTQELMDLSADGHPKRYRDPGPGGLGLRTYLGPFIVEQVGLQRLTTLPSPAQVFELPWGGVRVDLAEAPWSASATTLRQSWRSAMEHLRPAEFFALFSMNTQGVLRKQRAARCIPGGVVRQESP